MRHALPLALALVLGTACGQTHELAVVGHDPSLAIMLSSQGFDVTRVDPGRVVVLGNAAEKDELIRRGFQVSVLRENLEQAYQAALATPSSSGRLGLPPNFGSGSMGGYYTAAEVEAAMDGLQSLFPNIVAPKVPLGTTVEGRTIHMWKISDNPTVDESEPEVLIDGGHHGREPVAIHGVVWTAIRLCFGYGTDPEITDIVQKREILLVPIVNVDGYVYNEVTNPQGGGLWRKNRRLNADGSFGVDPNRNYSYQFAYDDFGSSGVPSAPTYRGPFPFSEPCTAAIRDLVLAHQIRAYLTLHTFGQMVLIPPSYSAAAQPAPSVRPQYEAFGHEFREILPAYQVGSSAVLLSSPANGTSLDWVYGEAYGGQQVWAFGAELGSNTDGFWPPISRLQPVAEEAWLLAKHILRIAGPDLRITNVTVAESGGPTNGAWDPGEVLDLGVMVRNGGTEGDTVQVRAWSTSPWLQVSGGPVTLGWLAPNDPAVVSTPGTLLVAIAPGAPVGVLASVTVEAVSSLGVVTQIEIRQPLGEPPVTTVEEDCESGPGAWIVGSPEDIPSAGDWVLDDPVGTSFFGTPYNPEDDATPQPGTHCWFTGQGTPGGSAGAADVDGITTLTSPIYDLTDLIEPTISFRRWLRSTTLSPNTRLETYFSNNGGATWRLVDTAYGNRPDWESVTMAVETHLPRTSAFQVRWRAHETSGLDLLEAGIDELCISGFSPSLQITGTGAPALGQTLGLTLDGPSGHAYIAGLAWTAETGISLAQGLIPLDPDDLFALVPLAPSIFQGFTGALDSQGMGSAAIAIPDVPYLSGLSFFASAVTLDPGGNLSGIAGARHFVIP